MTYLGITQKAAGWVLGKPMVLEGLYDTLMSPDDLGSILGRKEFAEGPVRFVMSQDNNAVLFWNVDYLSGTGDEPWGFINIDGRFGITEQPGIAREVLERALYIVNQRLQGYLISGAYIHRSWDNGSHTLLAARGTEARQYSLGYVERDIQVGKSAVHALITNGPAHDIPRLSDEVVKAALALNDLVASAAATLNHKRRRETLDASTLPDLRAALSPYVAGVEDREFGEVSVDTGQFRISTSDTHRTAGWVYKEWLSEASPLSAVQRRLLFSQAVERHPVRILGPGGSGKSLLMQLLALRRLEAASEQDRPVRILYLVHNSKMGDSIKHRFEVLQGGVSFVSGQRELVVQTLSEYGRAALSLEETLVIDRDAHEAKEFQLEVLSRKLKEMFDEDKDVVHSSNLLREVRDNSVLMPVLAYLLMSEISTAIKGHGLESDPTRYVESERKLSRLHGVLSESERGFVFNVFKRYHHEVFETYGVLDSDDVALSLLGKLRTPIWELKRKKVGFDYVFVDEAQLFNENEKRIFSLLTRGDKNYVPLILALDEAQDLYGQSTAGLATLGIENVTNESLSSIHRSTKSIIQLAFDVIQQSTDLFGPEFPDFTGVAEVMEPDSHPMAAPPIVETAHGDLAEFGRFIVRRIRNLRRANLRRLAVICYSESYWATLLGELQKAGLPLHVLEERGERLPGDEPVVVLSRPAYVGGQEFDAVVLVGLEQGLVPPRVVDNEALAMAVEQQAIREIYLGITRARFQLVVALPKGSSISPILRPAERAGHINSTSA